MKSMLLMADESRSTTFAKGSVIVCHSPEVVTAGAKAPRAKYCPSALKATASELAAPIRRALKLMPE